jgi:hypothetical protein
MDRIANLASTSMLTMLKESIAISGPLTCSVVDPV